jgi:hypothetical protein
MGIYVNSGLDAIAAAMQTGASCTWDYVGISPGCGTLKTAISSGVAITTIALNTGLPAPLSAGQSLTITDGTNTETATVAAGGAAQGATSIPINSWTPAHSYAINVTVIAPTPAATDTALYNETVRVAIGNVAAGASAGESLFTVYFDGTQPTGVYLLVGYFGGASATSSTGTGTLMAEDTVYWNHVVNSDSNMFQADAKLM